MESVAFRPNQTSFCSAATHIAQRSILLWLLACFACPYLYAEQLAAKYKVGSMHGYLLVKAADEKIIGTGEFSQIISGSHVSSKATFRFGDGSLDEDESIFTQRRLLQLVTDHHIQKGPSFPKPVDIEIDVAKSKVIWHETKDKKVRTNSQHMVLPADLMNGMLSPVFINIAPSTTKTTVSYLSIATKPRVISLIIKPVGEEVFSIGDRTHKATRYNVHPELGGVTGLVASIMDKEPSDMYAYVVRGLVPTFAKLQASFYEGGPVWTVELASPNWGNLTARSKSSNSP